MLTTHEAASYLRLSARTLERLRVSGTGSKFVRLNHSVRYRPPARLGSLHRSARRSLNIGEAKWLTHKPSCRQRHCLRQKGRTISDLAKLINDKVAQMVSSARTTRQDRPDVGRGGTDAAPQWRSTAQKEIRVTQDEGDGNERTRTRTRT